MIPLFSQFHQKTGPDKPSLPEGTFNYIWIETTPEDFGVQLIYLEIGPN